MEHSAMFTRLFVELQRGHSVFLPVLVVRLKALLGEILLVAAALAAAAAAPVFALALLLLHPRGLTLRLKASWESAVVGKTGVRIWLMEE